jgi:hypothetical protein
VSGSAKASRSLSNAEPTEAERKSLSGEQIAELKRRVTAGEQKAKLAVNLVSAGRPCINT